VEVSLVVSGDVNDFDTTARQSVITAFANNLNIDPSRVQIISVTQGSVVFIFKIINPTPAPSPALHVIPQAQEDGIEAWKIAVPVVLGVLVIGGVVLVIVYCTTCCKTAEPANDVEKAKEVEKATAVESAEKSTRVPYGEDGDVENGSKDVDKANEVEPQQNTTTNKKGKAEKEKANEVEKATAVESAEKSNTVLPYGGDAAETVPCGGDGDMENAVRNPLPSGLRACDHGSESAYSLTDCSLTDSDA